jgi:hypothetical protein
VEQIESKRIIKLWKIGNKNKGTMEKRTRLGRRNKSNLNAKQNYRIEKVEEKKVIHKEHKFEQLELKNLQNAAIS